MEGLKIFIKNLLSTLQATVCSIVLVLVVSAFFKLFGVVGGLIGTVLSVCALITFIDLTTK